ncbi:MAG: hypothetical protein WCF04_03870 [Candidatus Nanopelagicales bacterium]
MPLHLHEPVHSTASLDLHCRATVGATTFAPGIADIRVTLRGQDPIRTGLVDVPGNAFSAEVAILDRCRIIATRGGVGPATLHDQERRAHVDVPSLAPDQEHEAGFLVEFADCPDAQFCEVAIVHSDPEAPVVGDSWMLVAGFPVCSAAAGALVVGDPRCVVGLLRGEGVEGKAPDEVLQWSHRVQFVPDRPGRCPHVPCFGEAFDV